ncbi:MAG: hypothetical protein K6A45_08315 [Lachnospiraceae bacterium]|nr:hypothetical protein [Lachnospiraceae bacterium]
MNSVNKSDSEGLISAYLQKNLMIEELAESLTDACRDVGRHDFEELLEAMVRKYILRNWKSFDSSAENYIDLLCSGLKLLSSDMSKITREMNGDNKPAAETVDRRMRLAKAQKDISEFKDFLDSALANG